jgi:hypothetical protein
MTAVAKDGLVIDGALRGAIAASEFYLVYQAITNANTGKMTKVERCCAGTARCWGRCRRTASSRWRKTAA